MENRYINRTHISERKFREILKYFSEDFTATQASKLSGTSRPTISNLYQKFRIRIYELCQRESVFEGEVEVDESYFGARRVRGKRGRGAKGKVPVIGLLKRDGKVYTKVVSRCTKAELMPVIKGKVLEESTVYTDGWSSYDSLVLNGYKHYRVYHSKDEFVRGRSHVNGIESFWSYAKRRMAKFNGVPKKKFILHLKESEFRWNYRGGTMYHKLLKNFRRNPL